MYTTTHQYIPLSYCQEQYISYYYKYHFGIYKRSSVQTKKIVLFFKLLYFILTDTVNRHFGKKMQLGLSEIAFFPLWFFFLSFYIVKKVSIRVWSWNH